MDYIKYLREMVGHKPVIMVAAGVAIFDKQGRVLMHHRKEDDLWGLVGGFMNLGETVEEAARREVYEEVGLELGEIKLFDVFDNPIHMLPSGDQVQSVMIFFTCHDYTGTARVNDNEGKEVEFVKLSEIPDDKYLKLPKVINAVREHYQNKTIKVN